jgi:glucose-fructose oxidoreductase
MQVIGPSREVHVANRKTSSRSRAAGRGNGSAPANGRVRARRPGRTLADRPARVRYAVVGLGYIAQIAVLPAFAHARRNSELAALVSDDPTKLRQLGRKYGIERTYSYDAFDECLGSGIDAVYIALPNHLHREYAVRAAKAGIHVLCEKPLAVTVEECEAMLRAAEENDVRLMVAYRLHFDRGNLEAVKLAASRRLGALRMFDSLFAMQVKAGDIRLRKQTGGGTLYDIGVYCINAARYLFQDEPLEVFAFGANNGEERFREVDEMTGAVLKFPEERIATFITSFGAADLAEYRLVGTKGSLRVENAYEYAEPMRHVLRIGGRTRQRAFPKHDQFAPELLHFSECVQQKKTPEPSGLEGLIDVAIVRALYRSAEIGKPVPYDGPTRRRRPTPAQAIDRPAVRPPELVHAESPSES